MINPHLPKANYRVLPLPSVWREARKLLTKEQLEDGIASVEALQYYPNVPELSNEPCGEGVELRIESPSINRQGWLRAIFWVHEKRRTIYIVDLFWKKTNKVPVKDLHRINHRVRELKALLAVGGDPWKLGK